MARLLLRLAFAAAIAGLSFGPAQATDRLSLRHDVQVRNDVVTFGDLLEGADAVLAATPVFRAPALGQSGTIQVQRVLEAAQGAGIAVDAGLASQVVVTRVARRVTKPEVEAALRAALAARYGLGQADLSTNLDTTDGGPFVEPDQTGELKVASLAFDARSQRLDATLTIDGSRALTLKPLRVTGQVVDMVDVPVLAHALSRGDTVHASDIRMDRRPRSEAAANADITADPVAAIGRVARNALPAGSILRDGDLAKQQLVDKNSVVSVVFRSPGLELSIRGKALEAGGIGDVILVQNIQSKRQLQATIVGPGQVSVIGAMPGPVASSQ